MINHTDKNTIDFIEYREAKKGIDINLYLDMELTTLMDIYQKCVLEMDEILSNLNNLDKELDNLKQPSTLSYDEKIKYHTLISSGKKYYDRYGFLEEKVDILELAMERINKPNS